MNIYLGEHFEKFIRDQVATGRYANASEVVREALREFEQTNAKRAESLARIQAGLEDMRAGRVTQVDDVHEFLAEIAERNREKIAAMKKQEAARAAS